MTGTDPDKEKGGDALKIAVLFAQEELGALLFRSLAGKEASEKDEVSLERPPATLFLVPDDEAADEAVARALKRADAVLLLIRFMDALTMDRLRRIRERLPKDFSSPLAVFLFREPDEIDFKIGCPACGQKLWVRDTDEGKRGRCPNCKTAFRLPSQPHHAKTELKLHGDTPAICVVGDDARSCRNALENLRGHLTGDETAKPFDANVLIRRTARIPIPDSVKTRGAGT